jgi:AhpD family alkylhydroperoxidase
MAHAQSPFLVLLDWAKTRDDEVLSNPCIQGLPMSHRIDYTQASPEGYKAFGGVYLALQKSGLPKELVDLVYLRISQINGCAYCIDMHSRDLLKGGLAVDKLVLVAVWQDGGAVFSRRERAALAWAESVTRVSDTGVPDADYDAAAAEFSAKELADLTYAIGLMNAFNRLGISFRVAPAAAVAQA